MKTVIALVLCTLILFAACKKDKNSTPNQTTPPVVLPTAPDTLGAGWTKVGSIPIEETVTDIFFTDLNNGYITTSAGVYKSSDGGSNWTKFITAESFVNIGAFGSNACFVNGSGNVYNTLNAGATTSVVSYTTPAGGLSFADCFYANSNICYASSFRYIWKSIDAGVNFDTLYNFNDTNGNEPSLFFVNDLNGWVTRNYTLYKTTDGGMHWNMNKTLSNDFSPLCFIDIDNGYVADGTNILRTSNGGTD